MNFEPCWTCSQRNSVNYTPVCTHCESESRGVSELDPVPGRLSSWLSSLDGEPVAPAAPLSKLWALCLLPGLKKFKQYFAFTQNCFSQYSQLQEERTPTIRFYFHILLGLPSILIQKTLAIHLTLSETSLLGLHISLSDRSLYHITLALK